MIIVDVKLGYVFTELHLKGKVFQKAVVVVFTKKILYPKYRILGNRWKEE